MLLQDIHRGGHAGLLLADSHVDADHALALLVDNRIDSNSGLTRTAIADNQLTLSAADRNHRVHGLKARLQRLFHRLSLDNAGGLELHQAGTVGLDWPLAVNRHTQGIDHAAQQGIANRHAQHFAGTADLVALANMDIIAENDHADIVFFEVERQPVDIVAEIEHLTGHAVGKAIHAGDSVANLDDVSYLLDIELTLEILYFIEEDGADFF